MTVTHPGQPSRDTGLPPGVEVGPLGPRVVAYLIEALLPAIVTGGLAALLPGASGGTRAVLSILGALLVVGWALVVWYMLAERAAGPGMRLMRIQLVGFYDGRPIGWVRVLLRALIFWVLAATGIGLIVMLVLLVLHPRRQGWHDLVAKAVVIKERVMPPPAARPGVAQHVAIGSDAAAAPAGASAYGAPAGYAPVPGAGAGSAPGYAPGAGYGTPPGYAPTPGYGPAPGYPPTPGYAQTGPGAYAPGSGAPSPAAPGPGPGAPTPGPAPTPEPGQPLAPPPGLGYPPRADRPYAPVGSDSGAAAPAGPDTPPALAPDPPWFADTRPMPVTGPAPVAVDWHAVLDDGRRLIIDHLVLLGRNPQPAPGEEDAELVKIADDTRTVSKLHLAVGVDPGGLFVVDRGSTNGSTVTTPNGVTRRCVPGETVYVAPGSIVSMGDHWMEIRRESE